MRGRVLVFGSGIAGLCCAKILAHLGWNVEVRGTVFQTSPILLLNSVTCALLRDIWQSGDELLEDSHILNKRKVCWGVEGPVSIVAEPGLLIRGDLLAGRLLDRLSRGHPDRVSVDDSSLPCPPMDPSLLRHTLQEFTWVVDASGRGSQIARILGPTKHHSFGCRRAICMEVPLTRESDWNSCLIETVQNGWAFLAPFGRDQALLQAMVPTMAGDPSAMLTDLLEQTHMVKTYVADALGTALAFKASPQMSDPLCGPGWITVGDAAVCFDPICGDGVGYAIRGAILAASVIDGIASGLPMSDCLHHYALRLHKAFFSHIKECLRYYSFAFSSSPWKTEIELMKKAVAHDEYHTATTEGLRYELERFRLVPFQVSN